LQRLRDNLGGKAQSKQKLVRQDVGCRGRRITVYYKPAEDSELVECNNPGKKINDTGQPGLEARRHPCQAFHRYGCAHIRFSDDQREIARRAKTFLRTLTLKGVSGLPDTHAVFRYI
jgi:hypothetical protein